MGQGEHETFLPDHPPGVKQTGLAVNYLMNKAGNFLKFPREVERFLQRIIEQAAVREEDAPQRLVMCRQGCSRSVLVVLVLVMARYGKPDPDACIEYVRKLRPIIDVDSHESHEDPKKPRHFTGREFLHLMKEDIVRIAQEVNAVDPMFDLKTLARDEFRAEARLQVRKVKAASLQDAPVSDAGGEAVRKN